MPILMPILKEALLFIDIDLDVVGLATFGVVGLGVVTGGLVGFLS